MLHNVLLFMEGGLTVILGAVGIALVVGAALGLLYLIGLAIMYVLIRLGVVR